jgi:hypothetical protein
MFFTGANPMNDELRIDDSSYQRGFDICAAGGTLRSLIKEVVAADDEDLAVSLALGFGDRLIAELRRPLVAVEPHKPVSAIAQDIQDRIIRSARPEAEEREAVDRDIFNRSMFVDDDAECGLGLGDLTRALVAWAAMQNRTPVVAEAAAAFNTTPEVIREAIDNGPWILWVGPEGEPTRQVIQLDGE